MRFHQEQRYEGGWRWFWAGVMLGPGAVAALVLLAVAAATGANLAPTLTVLAGLEFVALVGLILLLRTPVIVDVTDESIRVHVPPFFGEEIRCRRDVRQRGDVRLVAAVRRRRRQALRRPPRPLHGGRRCGRRRHAEQRLADRHRQQAPRRACGGDPGPHETISLGVIGIVHVVAVPKLASRAGVLDQAAATDRPPAGPGADDRRDLRSLLPEREHGQAPPARRLPRPRSRRPAPPGPPRPRLLPAGTVRRGSEVGGRESEVGRR
jgi:hypothetical protein